MTIQNYLLPLQLNYKNKKNIMEAAIMDMYDVFTETKTKFIEGFTPQQRAEFNRGISIEDYAREKGIRI